VTGTIVFGVDLVGELFESKARTLKLQSAFGTPAKMKSLVIDGELDRLAITERTGDSLRRHELGFCHCGIFSEITFSHGRN
jgi:hypothetical protein